MVEDANASGHVFRKLRLGQRTIPRKNLGAWDDMIRPDRIIICAGNPELGRRFLVYKGRTTKDEQTTDYETDRRTDE